MRVTSNGNLALSASVLLICRVDHKDYRLAAMCIENVSGRRISRGDFDEAGAAREDEQFVFGV